MSAPRRSRVVSSLLALPAPAPPVASRGKRTAAVYIADGRIDMFGAAGNRSLTFGPLLTPPPGGVARVGQVRAGLRTKTGEHTRIAREVVALLVAHNVNEVGISWEPGDTAPALRSQRVALAIWCGCDSAEIVAESLHDTATTNEFYLTALRARRVAS